MVVSYDIVEDGRRNRLANLIEDFGVRIQYSVFNCVLAEPDRQRLATSLAKEIDPVEDSVVLYRLCRRCERRVVHLGKPPPDPDPQLLIL